jgi:hypothetical protein
MSEEVRQPGVSSVEKYVEHPLLEAFNDIHIKGSTPLLRQKPPRRGLDAGAVLLVAGDRLKGA